MQDGDTGRVQRETWLVLRQLDEKLADCRLERDGGHIAWSLDSSYGKKRGVYAQTGELERIARRAEHRARGQVRSPRAPSRSVSLERPPWERRVPRALVVTRCCRFERLRFLRLSFIAMAALSFIGYVSSASAASVRTDGHLQKTHLSHFAFRCTIQRYSGGHRPRRVNYSTLQW